MTIKMKLLIVLATFFSLRISVFGDSILVSKAGFEPMNTSQSECIAKIDDTEISDGLAILLKPFTSTFERAAEEAEAQESSSGNSTSTENLEKIIIDTCHREADENLVYNLTKAIFKPCTGKELTSMKNEQFVIKKNLKKVFCNVLMKLAFMFSFEPECERDLSTARVLKKCSEDGIEVLQVPIIDWFNGSEKVCKAHVKSMECFQDVIKGSNCTLNFAREFESLSVETLNFVGCASKLH